MSPIVRLFVGLVVQVGFLALAIYLAVSESALPGASHLARVGLAFAVLAVGMLWGEVARVRGDMSQLLRMLRENLVAERDDRAAIDVLVAAVGSGSPERRATAHKHLVRLTGQQFPPDPVAWAAWWKDARPTFREGREPAEGERL